MKVLGTYSKSSRRFFPKTRSFGRSIGMALRTFRYPLLKLVLIQFQFSNKNIHQVVLLSNLDKGYLCIACLNTMQYLFVMRASFFHSFDSRVWQVFVSYINSFFWEPIYNIYVENIFKIYYLRIVTFIDLHQIYYLWQLLLLTYIRALCSRIFVFKFYISLKFYF